MGLARALRRVKKQAKRGGLGALRSGLGEELRSGAIPGPLRSAARRIAAIIDPHTAHGARKPGSTATPAYEAPRTETLRHAPPAQANKLGSDRGDAPVEPTTLSDSDAVNPISVGATPVYDATPVEAEPVDATPQDVVREVVQDIAPVIVSNVETSAAPAPVEDVVLEEPAPAKPAAKTKNGASKKKASAPAAATKEKLAPAPEAAKSAARSAPKAKRSGGQAGKTSKKK